MLIILRDAADSLQAYLISFTCYLAISVEHRDIKNIFAKNMPYAYKIIFGKKYAMCIRSMSKKRGWYVQLGAKVFTPQ